MRRALSLGAATVAAPLRHNAGLEEVVDRVDGAPQRQVDRAALAGPDPRTLIDPVAPDDWPGLSEPTVPTHAGVAISSETIDTSKGHRIRLLLIVRAARPRS